MIMKKLIFFLALATVANLVSCSDDDNGKTDDGNKDPLTYDEGVVINGVKWATRNVGAPGTFASTPQDPGLFYQWGSNVGWSVTNPLTASDGNNTWRDLSGTGDPSPEGWRVPTDEELKSLANAESQWTTVNGVNGRIFGSGNNTIFLPAVSWRYYLTSALDDTSTNGKEGRYWSSKYYDITDTYSYLGFSLANVSPAYYKHPQAGFNVRCVAK
jgi:uncharacterized protein (TIGR02145 family)